MHCKHLTIEDLPEFIFGGDGEGEANDEGTQSTGEENSTNDNNGANDEGNDDDDNKDPAKGLKSALDAERRQNRANAKRIKELEKAEKAKADAEKSEIERLTEENTSKNDRLTKLAQGFKSSKVNAAISKLAEKHGFVDVSDAIAGVDLSKVDIEQDEDDPTIVDIDSKALESAVKALATKKPHFIKKGTDDGEATGQQFGGSNKNKDKNEDAALRERYSAL